MKHFFIVLTVALVLCFSCTKTEKNAHNGSLGNGTGETEVDTNDKGLLANVPTFDNGDNPKAPKGAASVDSSAQEKNADESTDTDKTASVADADFTFTLTESDRFGTLARARVNDDNVNVRIQPSTSAEKFIQLNKNDIVTIKGFSTAREEIDGFNGYWLKIKLPVRMSGYYNDCFGGFGWIFSKYVDIDPAIAVSAFSGKKEEGDKPDAFTLVINRNGEETEEYLYGDFDKEKNCILFTWSDDRSGFMFNDPVGTFEWYPETGEVRHLTYMGYDGESAWCEVTDDGKYFMQDFGTSPGVRGVGVYETATNKVAFEGTHYGPLLYEDDCVDIVEKASWYNVSSNKVSAETVSRAREYEATFTKSELEDKVVVVRYRLNLVTKECTFIECFLITEQ